MLVDVNVSKVLLIAAGSSLFFLAKTIPFMALGVIFAELIVALKVVDKIAFIARPITNFAHLRDECGASFLTAFVSAASADAMLAAFYKDGLIEKRELFIASMVTSFPAIVMHWRPMLPVLIPLLGVVGIIYFGMLMLVGLIKTVLIMIAGRFLLVKKDSSYNYENSIIAKRPPLKEAMKLSLQTSKPIIKRIVAITIPTTFIVFILLEIGVFDTLSDYLSGVGTYFPVPAESISIIAAQFASFIASATVASNLLMTGMLTGKEVVITLLVADVLSTIMVTIRWRVPYYFGIFGPRIGVQILALATTIRTGIMLSLIFALAIFWM
jgi:hypothetical protein